MNTPMEMIETLRVGRLGYTTVWASKKVSVELWGQRCSSCPIERAGSFSFEGSLRSEWTSSLNFFGTTVSAKGRVREGTMTSLESRAIGMRFTLPVVGKPKMKVYFQAGTAELVYPKTHMTDGLRTADKFGVLQIADLNTKLCIFPKEHYDRSGVPVLATTPLFAVTASKHLNELGISPETIALAALLAFAILV
jgi:hypothetical protein